MQGELSEILTVHEAAAYLKLSRSTVYRLLKRGVIPAFKIGSDWRFSVAKLDAWRLAQDGWQRRSDS